MITRGPNKLYGFFVTFTLRGIQLGLSLKDYPDFQKLASILRKNIRDFEKLSRYRYSYVTIYFDVNIHERCNVGRGRYVLFPSFIIIVANDIAMIIATFIVTMSELITV